MPIHYDCQNIEAWLGAHTVRKAADYARAVSDVQWQEASLSGKVQGTARLPYVVEIQFRQTGNSIQIDSDCTCPVGYHCKHVAALLIAGLNSQPSAPASGVGADAMHWLEAFRARYAPPVAKDDPKADTRQTMQLGYVVGPGSYRGDPVPEVSLYKMRVLPDGVIRAIEPARWFARDLERVLNKPPQFLAPEDTPILRGLLRSQSNPYRNDLPLQEITGAALLEQIVATGRALVVQPDTAGTAAYRALRRGAARHGQIIWDTLPDGRVKPSLTTEPPGTLLVTSTDPCWYLDAGTGRAGTIELPWATSQLRAYLSMPSLTPEEAALVTNMLQDIAVDLPAPPALTSAHVVDIAPVPVLNLDSQPTWAGWPRKSPGAMLDFATISFDYGGYVFDALDTSTLWRSDDGAVVQIRRQPETEQQRLQELHKLGFRKIPARDADGPFPKGILGPKNREKWPELTVRGVAALRRSGWRVLMTQAFRHNAIEIEGIDGRVRQREDGWFDVEMGITVNGRQVRLEPLLADLFRRDARWLSGALEAIADDELVDLKTDQNERLLLRADRLKPVVAILIDLFDTVGEGELSIPPLDVIRLSDLDRTGRWQFHGDASVQQLAQRLLAGPGVSDVSPPAGLRTELRTYQRQGLAWMQFLRDQKLSGVLADDMGLGKTVQTLAHILTEKEAGRLDRPVLVVMPTSLVHNWCDEAARFTPDLRVLVLHGAQRHTYFDTLGDYDLVLTTYALLWRDQEHLAQHEYHLLILDEAQYVKNAATKSAATIRALRTRHRLCLTGTPLENHLGELWAQFDFLLPGFLGSRLDFGRRWRAPIEKHGDGVRRELLARRIRPFMLRRRKDEVAAELPPKTVIVRKVELEGAQRDFYETVRAAMQLKVQQAIQEKGFARSHIVMLEALLKLRQVCCDPRLVKLDSAKKVRESAKLELLLEMLPELIDEGRRILLFSQFTGMLALIATALDQAGIAYVTLTGDTVDRAAPVAQFMRGDAPLFLISLKAGGVGLNLTAADTVIHYDPWWNPAVENQATDRAHRLGQDKPVFVYKLITAGSVEEKIVAMQDQKAALADAILSDDGRGSGKFSQADLEALFEASPEAGMSSSQQGS